MPGPSATLSLCTEAQEGWWWWAGHCTHRWNAWAVEGKRWEAPSPPEMQDPGCQQHLQREPSESQGQSFRWSLAGFKGWDHCSYVRCRLVVRAILLCSWGTKCLQRTILSPQRHVSKVGEMSCFRRSLSLEFRSLNPSQALAPVRALTGKDWFLNWDGATGWGRGKLLILQWKKAVAGGDTAPLYGSVVAPQPQARQDSSLLSPLWGLGSEGHEGGEGGSLGSGPWERPQWC